MRRPRLYLSGPISKPATAEGRQRNWQAFCDAHHTLFAMGYAVNNPGLTMALPDGDRISHDGWMENDLPWVRVAEVVFRLPGESAGADMETGHALAASAKNSHPIDILYTMDEAREWIDQWRARR